jgi:hypothetical protein
LATDDPASFGDVFINCPFDDDYAETFRALIFTIYACGFRPRSARVADDAGEPRIEKLYRLIEACRYGIRSAKPATGWPSSHAARSGAEIVSLVSTRRSSPTSRLWRETSNSIQTLSAMWISSGSRWSGF